MPTVTSNAVIVPHPAPVVDLLTDEPPPPEDVAVLAPAAEPPAPSVKREPTSRPAYDPEIYCGVPPLPAGWCQPDFGAPAPPLPPPPKRVRVEAPEVSPLISVAELAAALGVALVAGLVMGGGISYLLSKPKIDYTEKAGNLLHIVLDVLTSEERMAAIVRGTAESVHTEAEVSLEQYDEAGNWQPGEGGWELVLKA
eukprot:6759923-Prymnesium_polylepis.2